MREEGRTYPEIAAERRLADKSRWASSMGSLSARELVLVGAAIYWAEGSKSKSWRTQEQVRFTNSDPAMVSLFLRFLDAVGVTHTDLRFAVQIHETADVAAAEAYWLQVVGGPPARFGKTSLKRHSPLTTRQNTGDDYHGCLRVNVLRSADLYRRIEGIWWAVSDARPSSLNSPSRVV